VRAGYEADGFAVVFERVFRPCPQDAREGERRVRRERDGGSQAKLGGDPPDPHPGAQRPQGEGREELPRAAVDRHQPRPGNCDDEGEVEEDPTRRGPTRLPEEPHHPDDGDHGHRERDQRNERNERVVEGRTGPPVPEIVGKALVLQPRGPRQILPRPP
jgi:hypothetical protein